MPEGTYPHITREDETIDDPPIIVKLEGDDEWYAPEETDRKVITTAVDLLLRNRDLALAQLPDYTDEHGWPTVISKGMIDGEFHEVTFKWDDAANGYIPT